MRSCDRAVRVILAALLLLSAAPAIAQSIGRPTVVAATDASIANLRAWDARVDAMRREGTLHLRRSQPDTLLDGRTHDRFDQYYQGLRVFGGDVSRQVANAQTVSVFGTVFSDIDLDTNPKLSEDDAADIIRKLSGAELGRNTRPELVVLPKDEGGYVLAYQARVFTPRGELTVYFIDAVTGAVALQYSDLQTQSAVGRGVGVLNDEQKVSASITGGRYVADDKLRPAVIRTYDLKGNLARLFNAFDDLICLATSDLANTSDNIWTDGADVDAHVYTGFTYDYYFKRFGRKGLDDANIRILSFTHPVNRDDYLRYPRDIQGTYYTNAYYAGSGTLCEGGSAVRVGVMVYGEGLPSNLSLNIFGFPQRWNFLAGALDVVGHELTHGVTEFTSDLIYRNESGALNEAFSDMMGTAIEFFFRTPGNGPLQANYSIGEDVVTPGGIRSLANPTAFGDPDHYSRRYVGTGCGCAAEDYGGVHINSGIPNQVFYLAIEGGTNRTSGLAVQGVGGANREQIERIMYRGFAQLMPSNATFAVARAVTIQAARDLYGVGSAPERAVIQAWTAVGVN